MAITGTPESSARALARPVVEPPPMATRQLASTLCTTSSAALTVSTGTCIAASANTPAACGAEQADDALGERPLPGGREHQRALGADQLDLVPHLLQRAGAEDDARHPHLQA